jgi:hypothetical protein
VVRDRDSDSAAGDQKRDAQRQQKKRNKAVKLLKTKVSCDESRDLIQNKHLLQSLAADHDQDRSNQRAERAANQGKRNPNVSENKGDASI